MAELSRGAIYREYDIFISYAREDEETAALPLTREFQSRGFSVWLDRLILTEDSKLEDSILDGLQNAYAPVVILSHHFLRKEWPKKELDILLAIEQVEDRRRIVAVRHGISDSELCAVSPFLATRTRISTSDGARIVCDKVIETFTEYADAGMLGADEADSSVSLATFFLPGLIKCPNASCTWRIPEEDAKVITSDPGPEFTLTKKAGKWYVACASCGTLATGSLERSDAKWILTFARMNL